MALILQKDKTITDAHGNAYSAAYAVIDQCNGNKRQREQYFVLETYKDQAAREAGLQPIAQQSYVVRGDEWDRWFSPGAITQAGDQYAACYAFLAGDSPQVSEDHKTTWQSDEVVKES